ncbi:hypothetical protein QJS10_CPA01g00458 [Acorus calamus]|uniref:Uncharacterized protein n=1 Tax=Acorus calamus TaxID=4465 RepID=A0AAV9FJT4_ACOCL|nr:hypothetical protein QJS10_CPA01g00458 [Acorus calamus]
MVLLSNPRSAGSGVPSPGLIMPEPARAVSAVPQLNTVSTTQLLQSSAISDQVKPAVPLQLVGEQVHDPWRRNQHDQGRVVGFKLRGEGEGALLQQYRSYIWEGWGAKFC